MKNTFKLLTVAAITTLTLCLTNIPQPYFSANIPVITESPKDMDIVDSAPDYGISPLSDREDDYKNE